MFFESLESRQMMVADAINDAGTTNENTALTTVNPGATTSLLANDTGAGLTVIAFTAASSQGATVSVAPAGTFNYNPATSIPLQALANTQSAVDTFVYAVSEGAATDGFRVNRYAAGFGDLNSVDAYLAGNPAPATTLTYPSVNIFHSDTTNQHFIGAGTASPFDDETVAPGLPAGDQDNYVIEATTKIWIPAAGRYTFSVNSDDGFGLSISGANLLNVYGSTNGTNTLGVSGRMIYAGGRGTADTFGVWDFPAAGLYPLRLVNWEGGGGSSVEMFAAKGDFTASASFAAAQTAGAQWRLVGDTFDANGIRAISPATSTDFATVSVTVTGVNGAPVAVNNSYATGEDTSFTVPALLEVPGMNVSVYRGTDAGIASIDNAIATGTPSHTGTVLQADFNGNNSVHFSVDNPVPGGAGDNYGVLLRGTLRVATAGTYTFGVNSDDASRIRIDRNQNGTIATDGSEDVAFLGGCCADNIGTPITLAVGDYAWEAMYTEGGGGDYGEFFYAPGSQGAFNASFKLIGDASGGIASYSLISRPGVLGNDTDEEASNGNGTQSLTVTQLNGGALTGFSTMGAAVTLNADGSFTYNPNIAGSAVQALAQGQVASDTFTYTVSDNATVGGALSSTATATITVTGANDALIANNNAYTTTENVTLTTTDRDVTIPRNNLGDTTPGVATDDGILVNDVDVDNNDVIEVVSVPQVVGTGMNVAVYNLQGPETGYGTIAGADKIRQTFGRVPNQTGVVQQADFIGNGGSPHFSVNNTFPGTGGDNYAVYLTGTLRVTTGGTYTFGVNSDDNSQIRIDFGNGLTPVATHTGCCSDQFGTPVTLAVGDYPFEAMYTEGGGGDYGEFFYAPGSQSSFNASFKLIGDASGGISAIRTAASTVTGSLGTLGNGSTTFTTTLGASVTLNDDGTFSYNPAGSTAIQALSNTQSLVDSFTYNATDNRFTLVPKLNVQVYNQGPGETINDQAANADAVRALRGPNFTGFVPQADVVGQPGGHFAFNNSVPGTFNDTNNYAAYISGTLRVTVAGVYTFGTYSDDNSRIRIDLNGNGNVNDDANVVTQSGCCGDVFGQATLAVGDYAFEAMYSEGGGGDYGEFFYASGTVGAFNSSFRVLGDNTGPILAGTLVRNQSSATVNITVNGINTAPVATTDTYATGEDVVLNVPLLAPVFGMNVAVFQGTGAAIATIDSARNSVPSNTGTVQLADFVGNGGNPHFPGGSAFPGTGGDNYGVLLTGTLRVNTAGTYTFGVNSDDASRIRIDLNQNNTIATDGSEDVAFLAGCCTDNIGTPITLAVGDYKWEAMYTEGGGGDYGEFFYSPGSPANFGAGAFRLIGDASGGIASISSFTPVGALGNDTDEEVNNGNATQTLRVTQLGATTLTPAGPAGTATGLSTMGAQVTLYADGHFDYNPNFNPTSAVQRLSAGQTAVDSFTYTVSDNATVGGALSSTGTVNITVTGANDLFTAVNNTYTTTEDATINATDRDIITPRNNQGDTTPANTNDDSVLVNDTDVDNNDVLEVVSVRTILGPGMDVAVYNQQGAETGYGSTAGADAIRNTVGRLPDQTGVVQQADFIGNGGSPHFGVNNTFPGTGGDNYAVYMTGLLRVTAPGTYTFGVNTDDNSRIQINFGGGLTTVAQHTGCCSDQFGTPVTLAAGDYPFEAMYTEGGGGDYGEFFYSPGSQTTFAGGSFKLLGDASGGIGALRYADTTVTGTQGTLGNGSASFVTPQGAAVVLNDDGTFTYNPTSSNTLQNLGVGQSLVDSFTYTAFDNRLNFTPLLNALVYNQGAGETISGTFATADTVRGSRAPNFSGTVAKADIVGQPGGHFNVDTTLPGTANNTENYAVYLNGVLRVTVAGTYTFGTYSDDNSRIRIDLNQNGNVNDDGDVAIQNGCCGDVFGQATLAVGDYAFEAMYTEGGGGDYGEFFYAPGTQGGFNSSFRLLGDNSGPIQAGTMVPFYSTATVNITVNAVNDNPVARPDGPFTTSENSTLTVTAAVTPGMNVNVYDGTGAGIGSADDARNSNTAGFPVNPPDGTGTLLLADLGTSGDGAFAGQSGVPAPGGGDSYAVFLTGIMRVSNANNPGNNWTFGTFADDASRIRIDLNRDGIFQGALQSLGGETVALNTGCCGVSLGGMVNIPDGDYAFELVFTEGGGGDYGEFFYAPGNPGFSTSNYALMGNAALGITTYSQLSGLMNNDSDRDIGDTISVDTATIISTNGATITPLANGSFTYNPATSAAAQALVDGGTLNDTFTYTLRDANGGSATAVVSVVVTGVSDSVNDNYTFTEDVNGTVTSAAGVLFNDRLPVNPSLEVVRAQATNVSGVLTNPNDGSATITTTAGGTVVINDNGGFTYNQNGFFNSLPQGSNGTDSFTYAIDGIAGTPAVATQSSNGILAVSATDLITGLIPTVTGNTLNGDEGTTNNPAVLTNGVFGTPGLPNNQQQALAQTLSISNNTTLTYALDLTASPFGYDISQIKTYSAWRDGGRDDQNYTVQYATVAAPGTFVNFTGAIAFAPAGGSPTGGEVAITSSNGLLAIGVGQIRFVFGNQENGYAGYRELDVIGTPRSVATVNLTINGVNDAPVAEANGPYNIALGQSLAVTGAGSTDVDAGTVLQYGWDLDNNGTVDYTSAPPPGNTTAAITIPWSALQSVSPPLAAGPHTIRLIVSDGITTSFDTATLNISDTFTFAPVADGAADGYLVVLNAAQTVIEIRDTPTNTLITSVPKAGTNSLVFTGNTDNETLTIDFTNTTPIPASLGLTFNAGGGTDGIVYRNGTVGTVAETYATANNGSTAIDARVVTYTGLESLSDTLTAPTRSFTYTGGNETVTLQNLVAGTSLQIASTIGVTTSFNKPTDSTTITLQTGSTDTLNITSATLAGNFSVNGSDGNDNVNVNGAVAVSAGATLPGLVTISGNNIAFVAGSITTPNNVNLTAAGTINSTTTAVDVSAAALVAASATGVDLDTSVATLSATASTAGSAVVIDEANAVTLQNVTTNNAAITINTLAAGDVTAENVNSGTAATSITVNNGNLVSGVADPGTADIVAGNLTLVLSTGARNYGVSAANRLEINATQLQANTAGGANNSAFIVDTAGGLQVTNSSLGATGVTVFDVSVLGGSLTGVVDSVGDLRAIQVIVSVTGATSTIGASAAAPLEINAATLAPSAKFDATTAGAATSNVWVTDVADNFPIGTINAGLGDVFLTTSFATGSIIDDVNDAVNDITAARLVLSATGGGVGNGATGNLETTLGSLEATAGTGGVALANTGNLVIGGISAAVGVSSTGGGVTISSTGSLTANENVTASGAGSALSLVTNDLSTSGQDLSIGANVTVGATTSVTLNSGDNFTMGANSVINSPSSPLVINIDNGSADTFGGTLTIPNTATLNTPSATFNGANPGTATDNDTFTFAPFASVPIVVNGFNPTSGSGDVLNLDLSGATGTTLTIDGVNDGTYTFTNRASVEYNSIEVVNAVAGAYDLVLNMAGFGTPGDFTIRRNTPFLGSNLEIVNNTTGAIPFAGAISFIASLTVLGTSGNDRLVIDDVNGMVSFDPLLTPATTFPDNPNGAGAPRLFFDAGAGVDTLRFNLTEAGAAQTYNIGTGSGPGAGDGEVSTTNTAGRNLVTYFTGLGNDGSSVVRSGSGAGAFTVSGDSAANTINVQANGTATRVDPVGYTPFDFAGNNFGTLGVSGGVGTDTLNLINYGSGQTNPLATVFDGGANADTIRVQTTNGNTGGTGPIVAGQAKQPSYRCPAPNGANSACLDSSYQR